MLYTAAIFDFDGTLLDTLDDLADCMNRILARMKYPTHPVDSYKYFVGDGMFNLAKRAAPKGTADDVLAAIAGNMTDEYDTHWADKTKPYDGIMEMLSEMRKKNLRVGLLSNKPDQFTQIMAKHFFPEGTFDQAFGARDNVPKKPDPAGALEIARNLGMQPDRFLYFGDTNTDMRTGRAAGMFTIGVTWGFRPVEELKDAGAHAIINEPKEALSFLS
jgi:haloacid dehalogenase superfamily, subfamily IA, variant 3 with third motif having DD or ED/haloacid dehalogenase superfamily, subfamily IA, variant 1 with third motif having Dx(3-4)D or Dx(3-4)E